MQIRTSHIAISALILGAGLAQANPVTGSALGADAGPDVMSAQEADAALRAGKLALEQDPTLERIPGQVLVRFTQDNAALKSAARALVSGRLIRTLKGVDGLEHLQTDLPIDQAVEMLSALPFVDYAEPDHVIRPTVTPNDTYISLQWGIHNYGQSIAGVSGVSDQDIDGIEGWDYRTSASGVVVAVIDTGVQWNHPDLNDNIWSNSGEIAGNGIDDDGNGYVDDIRGWDFYSNDNNPNDGGGHGTHVAGTVGAEGDNGIGVAGVAWDVQIMPLRFLGAGGGSTSDAVDAIDYAVDNGARISNNSWGSYGYSYSLSLAISSAASSNHLFIAAAGNDGVNTDVYAHYPSSYTHANIISVAAIDNQGDLVNNSVWASNYGASSVDLGAPGDYIASTYPTNSYAYLSGTSMAAPHVSGAAALVLAENPGWSYSQIKSELLNTAAANASLSGNCVTGGVLNLEDALD